MLDVAEARRLILSHARPLPDEPTPLHAALGRALAEAVRSDLDMPPFDKALMDGYAVRAGDPPVRDVIEEVGAGQVPTRPVGPGQATRIMTGAPLPHGADAVVPVERTTALSPGRVQIDRAEAGQFILRRAAEYAAGRQVLAAGTLLRPQEVGVLASVGRDRVRTVPPARVAVLATGDELVEPPERPGPGQLRNSNSPMLHAQALRAGAVPRYLGIGRDSLASLGPLVEEGLRSADVLVLSGGVSAGNRDLVPAALSAAGVTAHFHHVAMKPGKPLLFGTHGARLVFGLPGNPVSSFVCFELVIRPALRLLAGLTADPAPAHAALTADFTHRSDRPTFHPARTDEGPSGRTVTLTPWIGSASLSCLLAANALVPLPAGEARLRQGERVPILLLED